jgi:Xaa-Pro aminopeptidase
VNHSAILWPHATTEEMEVDVTAPFPSDRLDAEMRAQGVEVVLATTRHNVQYLLGGYRYFFFAGMDAIGLSRYLPVVGYVAEDLDAAFYVGCGNEGWGTDVHPLWVPDIRNVSWSSLDSARAVADALRARGLEKARIAVEYAFIPADALDELRSQLPAAEFVDGHIILETLRGAKSPEELELVREASECIISSMLETFSIVRPGMTKREIVEVFRRQQTNRGLVFDYCLVAVGPSLNRAPSPEVWKPNTILSLDSGGMYEGYIGDLARMAVHGKPTGLMVELMDEVEAIQQAARRVIKAGAEGSEIYGVATDLLQQSKHSANMTFLAHGMGLITHEVPRLTATGPVPYPADHVHKQLEVGNVLSIETWVEDPSVGFVKLEDTLIVTDHGYEAPGDFGRGYNIIGG